MRLRTILWKELWLRKSRMVSGLLAITLGIAIIVGIQSVASVSERAVAIKLDNLGANILVLPQAASVDDYYTADIDAPTFPEEYVERVATSMLPGVDNLSPKLTRRVKVGAVPVILTGILPANELASKPIWQSAGLDGAELAAACGVSPEVKKGPSYIDERLQRKAIDSLAPTEVLAGSVAAQRPNDRRPGLLFQPVPNGMVSLRRNSNGPLRTCSIISARRRVRRLASSSMPSTK